MNGRVVWRKALCVAAWLGLASPAWASPADTFGVLPRGVATAGTQTASADDAGAAYYNPAGLALAGAGGKASVLLGFGGAVPNLDLDRAAGGLREPPNAGQFTAAFVLPLGGKIRNRASLGAVVSLPRGAVVAGTLAEPRDPQFLRFNNVNRLVLAFGLGVQLHEMVSVGVGGNVLAGLSGKLRFDIELFEREMDRRDVEFNLFAKVAPVTGVTITPHKRLRMGFTWRGSLGLDVDLPVDFNLGNVGSLDLWGRGVIHYTPHQLTGGVQYEVNDRLTLAFDLNYSLWSRAPYPALDVDVALGGEIVEGLGLDEVFTFGSNDPKHGFTDTLSPSFAAEFLFPDGVTRMRAGYAFRPTFVPNQVHDSNFLDNNAHVVGLGATFHLTDPTGVFSRPVKFDLGGQFQIMERREVRKSRGGEQYTFGGTALALGGAFRYEFE